MNTLLKANITPIQKFIKLLHFENLQIISLSFFTSVLGLAHFWLKLHQRWITKIYRKFAILITQSDPWENGFLIFVFTRIYASTDLIDFGSNQRE